MSEFRFREGDRVEVRARCGGWAKGKVLRVYASCPDDDRPYLVAYEGGPLGGEYLGDSDVRYRRQEIPDGESVSVAGVLFPGNGSCTDSVLRGHVARYVPRMDTYLVEFLCASQAAPIRSEFVKRCTDEAEAVSKRIIAGLPDVAAERLKKSLHEAQVRMSRLEEERAKLASEIDGIRGELEEEKND